MTLSPCRTLQTVLQTQKCVLCLEYAKANRCVFKCFANVSKPKEEDLKSTGKAFQRLLPATAKDLKPQSVRWLGTTMSPRAADHIRLDWPTLAPGSPANNFKIANTSRCCTTNNLLILWRSSRGTRAVCHPKILFRKKILKNLAEVVPKYRPSWSLRSSAFSTVIGKLWKTSMVFSKSFSSAASNIWNKLPGQLSSVSTLPAFRNHPNTTLFSSTAP